MKFTYGQFLDEFPTDEACLKYLFEKQRQPCCSCHGTRFYRVYGRLSYVCYCGKQIHPLKGTIFEKSRTPLRSWFYVIYLFSVSRNGLAATEIQRQLGVTYKTAWRMGHKVRWLMRSENHLLSGIVEVDETYIGGRHWHRYGFSKKYPIFGAVERNGSVYAAYVRSNGARVLIPEIYKTVKTGTQIYSDEYAAYKRLGIHGYKHDSVKHAKYEWARGEVYTNTIEGFWGQLKRSLKGTHHSVSRKWVQSYVDEFVFKYNHRSDVIFWQMLYRC